MPGRARTWWSILNVVAEGDLIIFFRTSFCYCCVMGMGSFFPPTAHHVLF